MLYFSQIYKEKVFTEDKHYVGKLDDLLFLAHETPLITKFVIKTAGNTTLLIPSQYVRKNGIGFIIKNGYEAKEKSKNEFSLLYQLQDQQIVDIDGAKIIRVNDITISNATDFTISGIDIGILGIFRWIGLANFLSALFHALHIRYANLISWADIDPSQLVNGRIVLKSEQEKLRKLHPEDLAEHLEHANIQNVLRSLKVMDEELSARVIADLNVDYQREIFQRFSPEHSGQVLSLIDPDEAVDVLLSLEDTEKKEEILKFIKKEKKSQIVHLLRLAKTPIGHLMSTEYITVSSEMTIREILEKIQKDSTDFPELHYVYAVNKEDQIVGVETLHELLLQKSDTLFYTVMNQNLILGRLTTPKEIALRRMLKYSIYALPIVDDDRKILGIVTLQNVAENLVGE